MRLSPETVHDLEILASFNLDTTMEGIKVHSDADPALAAAVTRLHDLKLLTQNDGGYLTELGREAAEMVQGALRILEVR